MGNWERGSDRNKEKRKKGVDGEMVVREIKRWGRQGKKERGREETREVDEGMSKREREME